MPLLRVVYLPSKLCGTQQEKLQLEVWIVDRRNLPIFRRLRFCRRNKSR